MDFAILVSSLSLFTLMNESFIYLWRKKVNLVKLYIIYIVYIYIYIYIYMYIYNIYI